MVRWRINRLRHIALSPNGHYLAVARGTESQLVYDTRNGEMVLNVDLDDDAVDSGIAFHPTGPYVATSSPIRVWNMSMSTAQPVITMKYEDFLSQFQFEDDIAVQDRLNFLRRAAFSRHLSYSSDGRFIATLVDMIIPGSSPLGNYVWLWDAVTGHGIRALGRHEGYVDKIAFNATGNSLATTSNNIVYIWNTDTGQEVRGIEHSATVSDIAFNPAAGTRLVTASDDKSIHIWDTQTGTEILRMPLGDSVTSIAFSPNGEYLATSSPVRVWDLETGREIARLPEKSFQGSFSPDGRYLVGLVNKGFSSKEATTVMLWPWQPDDVISKVCARLTRNITYDEWQLHIGDEPYKKTCEKLPVHPSLRETARSFAKLGDTTRARTLLELIQELEPRENIHPDSEARDFYALEHIGDWTGNQQIEEALAIIQRYKLLMALMYETFPLHLESRLLGRRAGWLRTTCNAYLRERSSNCN